MKKEDNLDVFYDDMFIDGDGDGYETIGNWGIKLLHVIKGSFVFYSGAHNIQASITATGGGVFSVMAQIVGVLVLEVSITAIYMAGVSGKITGRLQALLAAVFWFLGMTLAGLGIVADSRLHAGYELGPMLDWYLSTGLYIAPVVMVFGSVLVVFTDPVLTQKIANARDVAIMKRERVRSAVIADKASHEARKIVHNIRLGAQRQMAIQAKKYYETEEVQKVLREQGIMGIIAALNQAGVEIANPQLTDKSKEKDDVGGSDEKPVGGSDSSLVNAFMPPMPPIGGSGNDHLGGSDENDGDEDGDTTPIKPVTVNHSVNGHSPK